MNDTLWFNRSPGENPNCDDVSDQVGEPCLLVHDGRADWVRHPQTGEKLRVKATFRAQYPCPNCREDCMAKTTELEGNLHVRDCPACHQFVFFKLPEGQSFG